MKKRSIVCICLIMSVMLVLMACSSGSKTGKTDTNINQTAQTSTSSGKSNIADADNVNPSSVYPIVKKGIKLKMAVPVNAKVQDMNTNELTKWIKEKSGIDIEFKQLSATAADAQTQINLMFTSGDLPDLVWGYGFSYAALSEYVDAGYIAPLDDYIKAYGDNYYTFLKNVSVKNAESYVKIDGKIYAVPTATELITNIYAGKIFRYQEQFAEKLGIKEPTTLDEFYKMLVAFRDNDPNGNGKKDEIPMMGYIEGNFIFQVIGSCFQYTEPSTFLKVNNGKVSFIGNNDLFKETVEYIRKLVAEGLYDPASFTQNAATQKTVNTQQDVLVGVDANGNMISNVYDTTMDRYFDMIVMQALKGPHGYQSTPVTPPTITRAMVMTSACKNPGAGYRLMDMMLSEEAAVRARIGVKGSQWADAQQGVPGRDGQQSKYLLLKAQEWIQPTTNVIWNNESIVHSNVMNRVSAVKDAKGHWEVGYKAGLKSQEYLIKTVTNEHLPDLLMSVSDSTDYEDLKKLITTYVKENATRFILGDRPMSEWNEYVAQFSKMGLDKYIQYAQKSVDAMNKK